MVDAQPLLSVCILTHNKPKVLQKLLAFLIPYTKKGVEICIVDDESGPETVAILESYTSIPLFHFYRRPLKKDFGKQRNFISSKARGRWIFHLDQDERSPFFFLEEFPTFLEELEKEGVDVVGFPRINLLGPKLVAELKTLQKKTEDVYLYPKGWIYFPGTQIKLFPKKPHTLVVHPNGWVNFPGTQMRLYRNIPQIQWKYTIHEQISGYKKLRILPPEEAFALTHEKPLDDFLGSWGFYETFPWRRWDKLKKNLSKRWKRLFYQEG